MTNGSNIISKVNFEHLNEGLVPATFTDNNKNSDITWTRVGNNTSIEIINGVKYIKFNSSNGKIYTDTIIPNLTNTDFSVEFDIIFDVVNLECVLFSIGTTTNSNSLKLVSFSGQTSGLYLAQNTFIIKSYFEFKKNIKYTIYVSKFNDLYSFYVDGVCIGYRDVSNEVVKPVVVSPARLIFGAATINDNNISTALYGKIANINVTHGPNVKHSKHYTLHSDSIVSDLNINNLKLTQTNSTTYNVNVETIVNSNVVWDLTDTNEQGVKTLSTTIDNDNNYTINIKTKYIPYSTDLFTYGDYKVNIILGLDNKKVTINDYTTSALTFEDGLIDKIETTIWNKTGTSIISSNNKIFDSHSFNTINNGDSLYTNSDILSGYDRPYTIDFYSVIDPDFSTTNAGTDLSLYTQADSQGFYQGLFIDRQYNRISYYRNGTFVNPVYTVNSNDKVKVNEINRYTITYDGLAIRVFLNEKIVNVIGSKSGHIKTDQPFSFLSYNFEGTNYFNTVKGIIDNINIHDGVATTVRNEDPNSDNLIVDLSFDGPNGSASVIDNGIYTDSQTDFLLIADQKTLVDQSTNNRNITIGGNVSYQYDVSSNISTYYFDGNNSYIDVIIDQLLDKDFTIEMYCKSSGPAGESYNRFFDLGYIDSNRQCFSVSNFGTDNPQSPIMWGYNTNNVWTNIIPKNLSISNSYNHICLMRKNKIFYLFVNGELSNSNSTNTDLILDGTRLRIGSDIANDNGSDSENIINLHSFRVTNGSAIYSVSGFTARENIIQLKRYWALAANARLSTDKKFDGFSSLYMPTENDYLYTEKEISLRASDKFTVSLDFIIPDANKNTYNCLFSNGDSVAMNTLQALTVISDVETSNKNKVYLYYKSNLVITTTNTIKYDVVNKISLICDSYNISVCLNGITTTVALPSYFTTFDIKYIGYSLFYGVSNMKGYIKNFKIYDGASVFPESSVGKTELNFNDNFDDEYGNSTWTNNGVGFDGVNSVKGLSAYFSSITTSYLETDSSELNFLNKNFKIGFDIKNTSTSGGELLSANSTSVNTNKNRFFIYCNTSGMGIGLYNDDASYTDTPFKVYTNTWYNINYYRLNNVILSEYNDVITQIKNINFDLNINNSRFRLGKPTSTFGDQDGIQGYIDNFRTHKEDIISDVDIYRTNTSCVASIVNNKLKLSSIASHGIWVKHKDCPYVKNFILETKINRTSGEACILFRGTYFSSVNDTYAYMLSLSSTTIGLAKGSNSSTGSFTWLSTTSLANSPVTSYNIKVIVDDNNIKIYCDDILYIDYTGSYFLNPGVIGFRSYALCSFDVEYYSIKDLDENLIYYKDFHSKIISADKYITNAAVHLPLETSADNIGFSNLTVNSVGNPTYHVIDGKKCIRFDAGKYLSINSNNIFNLGTAADFYIEFDFYPTVFTGTGGIGLFGNHVNASRSPTNGSTYVEVRGQNDTLSHKKVMVYYRKDSTVVFNTYATTNEVNFNQFNNLIIKMKNNNLHIILNGIETIYRNTSIPLNYSASNTVIGQLLNDQNTALRGYMSNFKMFVGTPEVPESYNQYKVLDLDFKPTNKSYLFKDNNNKCVIHPVNINYRDYIDGQYCCTFNGTTQYLQLGKNNLLNLGNDDFVIYLKFYLNSFDNNYQTILGAGGTTGTRPYVTVVGDTDPTEIFRRKIRAGATGSIFLATSTNEVNIGLNECYIIRKDNVCTIILNNITSVGEFNNSKYDLNFNNNTTIGRNDWDGAAGYFTGSIFSIKILRNTSNIDLLDYQNINTQTISNIRLTNGEDTQEAEFINYDNNEFKFINGDSSVKLISQDSVLEVSKTTNLNQEDLIVSNDSRTQIKNVTLYESVVEDYDTFEGNNPIDVDFECVDVYDIDSFEELNIVDQGTFVIKGFFEGCPDTTRYSIRNKYDDYELSSGIGDFYYNGLDERYIDDYVIINLDNNSRINIPRTEMVKGSITISVGVLDNCGPSDFAVRVYSKTDDKVIGVYELINNVCIIDNLDCNKRYDCILFDRNVVLESRVLSNRIPIEY